MTDAPAKAKPAKDTDKAHGTPDADKVEVRERGLPKRATDRTTLLARTVFWISGLMALGAAGFALVAASTAGWHGFMLLSGIAFVAFILLFALAAGENAARSLRAEPAAPARADALTAAALDAASDPMLITDVRGRCVWANARYRELAKTIAPLASGISLPAPDRLWPGSAGGALYRLSKAAASGQTSRETLTALGGSGGAVYAVVVDPIAMGGALWRFTAERSGVLEAEPGVPDWAEHAPVGLFMADGEGRVLAANATLRTWLDVAEGQALKVKDFLAGDMAKSFIRTRGEKGIVRLDARLLAREGVESPVTLAVEWDEGRPERARVVVYGLTAAGTPPGVAQVIAQHTGGRSGRTFDDMFASAPFGVARLDGADPSAAIVEDSNPAFLQLSGGSAIPGTQFADLFDWTDGESAEKAFARALSGRAEPVALTLKAGDAGARDVHLFLAPARSGKRAAYIVDITELRKLEGQYAQAQKLKAVGALVSRVAHDFNNFLTAIKLNTDELLVRHPVGDPSYPELQNINAVVAHAAGRIKHLLAFARKQTLRVETVDLTETLADAVHLLRQSVEEWMRIELRHGRDVPLIRIDRDELVNALMNLTTNARDAMAGKGKGTLTITTEAVDAQAVRQAGAPDATEGRWAAIHVTDEGSGMDEETMGKIFEPFFTTKEPGKGTGLGLATVYGIVKQSGGFLFARSRVGEGTTFTLYLPGHEPDAEEIGKIESRKAEVEVPRKPADLAGRGRILLVEDEAPVRTITASTLIKRGYEVVEAEDGEEALEKLEAEPGGFDLIISDVVMPGLDGPGLLKAAKAYLGDARIIFISGYAEEHFSHTLSADLDISFLPKPFSLQALAERVKDELGR